MKLQQLLTFSKSTWTKFSADIAVWNRVVHGFGAEYRVERQQETNHSEFNRRSTDAFLTGEELKARLLELA